MKWGKVRIYQGVLLIKEKHFGQTVVFTECKLR